MKSKKLTFTILSMSLLTVMAGAAIAPALGRIRAHFADAPDLLVQLILSMPSLFIIFTTLFFGALCRRFKTRTIALTGLVMYVVMGTGAFFVDSIGLLLVLRALLGVSVGMIMPLSTGLLAYYFPPEEQAGLMGLSGAMNQLGGVVANLLAGLLSTIRWNDAFLVYLLGLVAVVLVLRHLPDERLASSSRISPRLLRRFHAPVTGLFLLMVIFFVYPTNFAVTAGRVTTLPSHAVTLIMVSLDFMAFLAGLVFGRLMQRMPRAMKYLAPVFFICGYALMAAVPQVWALIAGSLLVGFATGVGVPYLNTVASFQGGRDAATTVMPLMSAALYLGQFLSPLVVLPVAHAVFGPDDPMAPFKAAVLFGLVFLLHAVTHEKIRVTT